MVNTIHLPGELRRKVENELQPGERIRWIEQPVPHFFTAGSIGAVLFGIPWTSFAIFWMWGVMGFKLPDFREGIQPQHFFALFGVPFVLIGFAMLSTPYWTWQAARETVYLITDQRAISIAGIRSTTIKSYSPDQLQEIHRREKADGTGDVIFWTRKWKDSDGDQRTEDIGFMGIRNPQEVERLLRQLAQSAT